MIKALVFVCIMVLVVLVYALCRAADDSDVVTQNNWEIPHTYYLINPAELSQVPTRGLMYLREFDQQQYIEAIGRKAWGMAVYNRLLTDDEAAAYEMVLLKEEGNADQRH